MRQAVLAVALAGLLVPGTAAAQPTGDAVATYRLTGTRIAVGQDVRIERDEEVTEAAVVVGGNLIVDGRVRDGVFVFGGDIHLSSTADVRGDVVVVGGQITRDPGARQVGRVSYVSLGEWWSRRSWGWIPTIRFGEMAPWLSLAGTIVRVSLLAVLMAALLIVARAPVARVGRAALAEPLRAFIVGLAAEILFLPFLLIASVGLIMTIIGIPFVAVLVPVAIVLAVFAFLLGFTAVACRVGELIEDRLGWRPGSAFIATAIGFMVLLGPTIFARLLDMSAWSGPAGMIFVGLALSIEFIAWTIGFGAALVTGLGRWHTVPPPLAAPPSQPTATAVY
jgi:hypothetical protein